MKTRNHTKQIFLACLIMLALGLWIQTRQQGAADGQAKQQATDQVQVWHPQGVPLHL